MNVKGKKILVTGGAGFIGSHLVEKLLTMGTNVICYDNIDDDFYPGKRENLRKVLQDERFKLIEDDILNYDSLSSTMKSSDLVFHIAGQAGIRYCNEKPMKAHRVNAEGTMNVLLSAKEHKIQKIVYASSSSIFGDPKYLPIDENHPTVPNSPYGASKLAGENYCLAFARVYGTNVSCLRYFSVFGPRGRPDQVIYAFADKIASGSRPVIFGNGNQTRDFTYVSDVVDATVLAMEREESSGQVFNIGAGSKISINELVRKVISGLGKEGVEPVYTEKSKGDFPETEANNEKARELLGWNPTVKVDAGLKLFLEWYQKKKGR